MVFWVFWGLFGVFLISLPPENVEESSQEEDNEDDTSNGAADDSGRCHGLSTCGDNSGGVGFGVTTHPMDPPPQNSALPLVLTLGQGLELVLGAVGAVAILGERLDPHHVGGGRGQLGDGDGGALAAQDRVAVLVHLETWVGGTWVGARMEMTQMEG